MRRRDRKKIVKWAQLSKIDRAHKKMQDADTYASSEWARCLCTINTYKHNSKEKQEVNKYKQLLNHWHRLHIAEEDSESL